MRRLSGLLALMLCSTLWSGGFETVEDREWTEGAVRRVLHAIAFGGQLDDAEIARLAELGPERAMAEILPDGIGNEVSLSDVMTELHALASERQKPIFTAEKQMRGLPIAWVREISRDGSPLAAHRVCMFETMYHLATTPDKARGPLQLAFYDQVAGDLDLPYQELLAAAAASGPIAVQYGHIKNTYRNGKFRGNDDFARELHQLFFGILGTEDPHHEDVTIEETALALTGIRVNRRQQTIQYLPRLHANMPLTILGVEIPYTRGMTMDVRVDEICEVAIEHPEARVALPRMFVTHFGEDSPPEWVIDQAVATWNDETPRKLLPFLRAYFASSAFHRPDRVRRALPVDLVGRLVNRLYVPSAEPSLAAATLTRRLLDDLGQAPFAPAHEVFGDITGPETHSSPETLRQWWAGLMQQANGRAARRTQVALPAALSAGEDMTVAALGRWLWQRLIADDLEGYRPEVEAQVVALLCLGRDFQSYLDDFGLERTTDAEELEEHIQALGEAFVEARKAQERVRLAGLFILGTPDAFVDRGVQGGSK